MFICYVLVTFVGYVLYVGSLRSLVGYLRSLRSVGWFCVWFWFVIWLVRWFVVVLTLRFATVQFVGLVRSFVGSCYVRYVLVVGSVICCCSSFFTFVRFGSVRLVPTYHTFVAVGLRSLRSFFGLVGSLVGFAFVTLVRSLPVTVGSVYVLTLLRSFGSFVGSVGSFIDFAVYVRWFVHSFFWILVQFVGLFG